MSSLAARMVEAPDTQPDAPTDAQTHAQHAHPASPGAAPIEDVAAPGVTEEGGKGSEYDGEGSAVADDDMDALPMRVRGGDAAVVAGRLLAEVNSCFFLSVLCAIGSILVLCVCVGLLVL